MSNGDQTQRMGIWPDQIPLFPLRGAVLLPRCRLPLNIFEPRYLAMTEHALGHGRLIGMVRPRHDDDVNPPLYAIGCAGRITSFAETDDGRFLITLTGVSRFRLTNEALNEGGFRVGKVDWMAFLRDRTELAGESPHLRERLLELLMQYLDEVGLSADWESIEGASAETIVNSVTMACPFEADEKQMLLEADTLDERAEALIALMEIAVADHRRAASERETRMQ